MCLALEGKSMKGKVDKRRGLTSLRIYSGLDNGKVFDAHYHSISKAKY
jgi:hypothetical protein